jgi:hypothetical protein
MMAPQHLKTAGAIRRVARIRFMAALRCVRRSAFGVVVDTSGHDS